MVSIQAVSAFYSAYQSLGLQGISTTTDSQPPTLTFAPGTSPQVIAEITAAAAAYDWTGATLPDPLAFQLAVVQDTTFPSGALLYLAKLSGVTAQTNFATMPILQAMWTLAIEADGQPANATTGAPAGPLYGNCTDGTPIVTKIEAYATQFNCPLVAAS